jgi:hypothetical protein
MNTPTPSAMVILAAGGISALAQGASPSQAEIAGLAREQVQRFKTHARELPPPGIPWFEALEGKSRVLVTAPHATAQMREGRLKGSDLGTGALAVVLHRLAETPTLYTTWASPSDPNYYDDNPFKEALAGLVRRRKPRLVLDLHASREDRPYDVDLGTLRGDSLLGQTALLEKLRSRLAEAGLRDLSDNAFPGERQATVIRFLHGKGVPCLQLEINARWLRPERGPAELQRFLQLAHALAAFIQDLEKS